MQQAVYRLATTGLVAKAEKDRVRPRWEEWIQVSAKRRTVLTYYCFDCVYRTMNNLILLPCTELKIMPAPAGKVLWQARDVQQWDSAYNHWLARWDKGCFLMEELMKRTNLGSVADDRLQMWLAEVDEFGMMIMVVVKGAWANRAFPSR